MATRTRSGAGDADADERSPSGLPIVPIPGSYGVPFFSAVRDRLDFYYFQGHDVFFRSRVARYNSTVFRVNMIPGPFMARHPGVVAVLDAESFRILIDPARIDKTDTVTGTFIPSKPLHGGYRLLAFRDTSDPRHTSIKNVVFRVLATRKEHFIPTFQSVYSQVFDAVERSVGSAGSGEFNPLNEASALDFVCAAFYGGDPPSIAVGPDAAKKAQKWLLFQLHPLLSKVTPLPWPIEDLLFHTFHFPPFLVKKDQEEIKAYFSRAAATVLDDAERELKIPRDELLYNVIFFTVLNAYGGIKVFLTYLLKWLTLKGPTLHAELAREVRAAVARDNGAVTVRALERMELVKSFVWEVLRMNPPVEYQYGRARADTVVESHDAAYRVKKGQMIFGFQPFATRDSRVFPRGDEFVADRFVSDEGRRLLKYVVWSNGAETEEPSATNKQCPGKDMVLVVGRLMVAELFLRYDTFAADVADDQLETKVVFKSLTKSSVASL